MHLSKTSEEQQVLSTFQWLQLVTMAAGGLAVIGSIPWAWVLNPRKLNDKWVRRYYHRLYDTDVVSHRKPALWKPPSFSPYHFRGTLKYEEVGGEHKGIWDLSVLRQLSVYRENPWKKLAGLKWFHRDKTSVHTGPWIAFKGCYKLIQKDNSSLWGRVVSKDMIRMCWDEVWNHSDVWTDGSKRQLRL